ncbi:unnamed protein product [Rotaria socialis]|uniref:Uncharacterized protein n=2 Tax=Rotaria socialis TaxID=392032 RepID=A0A820X7P6_9BILA|nr:unnamed protein product [Rotaria socialis]
MSTPGYDDPRKDRSGPAACQGSIVQIYYTRSDELSYYKRNSWSSTDNGCEVTSNYSHGNAFEMLEKKMRIQTVVIHTSTSLVEGQCLGAKLPDTVNVAIQIGGTQVHERYATKQNDFDEKKSTRIISKCSLNHRCHNT